MLSSENITFLHCVCVLYACSLANARLCSFILSFMRGFLAAVRDGNPKCFCSLCCIVRTLTLLSRSGCKPFNWDAVSRGSLFNSLFNRQYVAFEVFYCLPPPYLCTGTRLYANPDTKESTFMMVDFALPVRSHIVLIGTFSYLHAIIRDFSSPVQHFPGMSTFQYD